MQVGAIPVLAGADHVVYDDLFEARDVTEGDWALHEREVWAASGPAQGAVFVVRGAVVPAAETLTRGTGKRARGVVGVEEREEVRS